jgi:phosphinothricin acetyltransferase
VITFEQDPVSVAEIQRRIEEVHAASLPWLIAAEADEILGYAYATKWRTRSAYRHSAEVTVYVDPRHVRRGVGFSLYARLFPTLEILGIHAVMAGIALPNEASVALHEVFGMQKAAHFSQVGFKLDRWIDVGYWQRML